MIELIQKKPEIFRRLFGIMAITFYVAYSVYFSYFNNFLNMLWICHAACFIVGIGLLCNWPYVNATGFLWLIFGVPMWLLNVFSGEIVFITSIFTHVGGLIISIIGLFLLGIPRYSWLIASVSMAGLYLLTRVITPPELNINLAFSVWKGWEEMFPSYFWYIVMLAAEFIVISIIVDFISRRVLKRFKKNNG